MLLLGSHGQNVYMAYIVTYTEHIIITKLYCSVKNFMVYNKASMHGHVPCTCMMSTMACMQTHACDVHHGMHANTCM